MWDLIDVYDLIRIPDLSIKILRSDKEWNLRYLSFMNNGCNDKRKKRLPYRILIWVFTKKLKMPYNEVINYK